MVFCSALASGWTARDKLGELGSECPFRIKVLKSVPCFPVSLLYFYFIFSFLAVLGLHCCTRAFSRCGKQGLLFIVVRRLLIAVASLVVEHGL